MKLPWFESRNVIGPRKVVFVTMPELVFQPWHSLCHHPGSLLQQRFFEDIWGGSLEYFFYN